MNLAIGFFDGVHLGHQKILACADAALTFIEHPLALLAPEKAPALLMAPEERLAAIAAALKGGKGFNGFNGDNGFKGDKGLNGFKDLNGLRVRALPFTRELAAESPENFANDLRRDYPDLETVFCGPNWNFGAGGAGNADFLRARGFAVETIPFEQHEGAPVSSTRIRAALKSGDLPLANAMLGRPFAVCGEVMQGKGEGRKIGFPTLNIKPFNPCLAGLLPFGVYAVDTTWGRGVANWGIAPTMGEQAWAEPVLEVHVVGRGEGEKVGRWEGEKVEVLLVGFLRPERRFESIEALRKQIASDVFSASHSP